MVSLLYFTLVLFLLTNVAGQPSIVGPQIFPVAKNRSSAKFTVFLGAAPTQDVVITPTSSNTTLIAALEPSLTFTPSTWNLPQSFTLRTGPKSCETFLLLQATSGDSNYNSMSVNYTINILHPIIYTTSNYTTTVTANTPTPVPVIMSAPPSADVTYTITTSIGSVTPSAITFTPANWMIPQDIIVTSELGQLSDVHLVGSQGGDLEYNDSSLYIECMGTRPIPMLFPQLLVGVYSINYANSYSVMLSSPPSAQVILSVTSSDPTIVAVVSTTLTFGPSDWAVSQNLLLRGLAAGFANITVTPSGAPEFTTSITSFATVRVPIPILPKLVDYLDGNVYSSYAFKIFVNVFATSNVAITAKTTSGSLWTQRSNSNPVLTPTTVINTGVQILMTSTQQGVSVVSVYGSQPDGAREFDGLLATYTISWKAAAQYSPTYGVPPFFFLGGTYTHTLTLGIAASGVFRPTCSGATLNGVGTVSINSYSAAFRGSVTNVTFTAERLGYGWCTLENTDGTYRNAPGMLHYYVVQPQFAVSTTYPVLCSKGSSCTFSTSYPMGFYTSTIFCYPKIDNTSIAVIAPGGNLTLLPSTSNYANSGNVKITGVSQGYTQFLLICEQSGNREFGTVLVQTVDVFIPPPRLLAQSTYYIQNISYVYVSYLVGGRLNASGTYGDTAGFSSSLSSGTLSGAYPQYIDKGIDSTKLWLQSTPDPNWAYDKLINISYYFSYFTAKKLFVFPSSVVTFSDNNPVVIALHSAYNMNITLTSNNASVTLAPNTVHSLGSKVVNSNYGGATTNIPVAVTITGMSFWTTSTITLQSSTGQSETIYIIYQEPTYATTTVAASIATTDAASTTDVASIATTDASTTTASTTDAASIATTDASTTTASTIAVASIATTDATTTNSATAASIATTDTASTSAAAVSITTTDAATTAATSITTTDTASTTSAAVSSIATTDAATTTAASIATTDVASTTVAAVSITTTDAATTAAASITTTDTASTTSTASASIATTDAASTAAITTAAVVSSTDTVSTATTYTASTTAAVSTGTTDTASIVTTDTASTAATDAAASTGAISTATTDTTTSTDTASVATIDTVSTATTDTGSTTTSAASTATTDTAATSIAVSTATTDTATTDTASTTTAISTATTDTASTATATSTTDTASTTTDAAASSTTTVASTVATDTASTATSDTTTDAASTTDTISTTTDTASTTDIASTTTIAASSTSDTASTTTDTAVASTSTSDTAVASTTTSDTASTTTDIASSTTDTAFTTTTSAASTTDTAVASTSTSDSAVASTTTSDTASTTTDIASSTTDTGSTTTIAASTTTDTASTTTIAASTTTDTASTMTIAASTTTGTASTTTIAVSTATSDTTTTDTTTTDTTTTDTTTTDTTTTDTTTTDTTTTDTTTTDSTTTDTTTTDTTSTDTTTDTTTTDTTTTDTTTTDTISNAASTSAVTTHLPSSTSSIQARCGNNILEAGEECDGNLACCDIATCKFLGVSTVCRSSRGICDKVEHCTGASSLCPVDESQSAFFLCAPSTNRTCNLATLCGSSVSVCPMAPTVTADNCGICGGDGSSCSSQGFCGDLYCNANQNETCSTCPHDCGFCSPVVDSCKNVDCGSHGSCSNGICNCDIGWVGAICDQVLLPVDVTFNASAPVLTVVNPTDGYTFKIDISTVEEITPTGAVTDYPVTNLNVTTLAYSEAGTTTYNYSITFPNGAYILASYMTVDHPTTITFANQKVNIELNMVKTSITVFNWPFDSPKNSLRVILALDLPDGQSAVTISDSNTKAQYMQQGNSKSQVYGKFLNYALIDGTAKVVTTTYDPSMQRFLMTIPRFNSYASIDPDFGIVTQDPNASKKDQKKNHWKIVVGTTVGIGGPMFALVIFAIIRHKQKKAKEEDIEMTRPLSKKKIAMDNI